ncbi:MAG TPA: hypothetical protein VHR66_30490 [Gemmataceae bacterium]|jgi:hypothetical protein|nr:hypothetical protein [Gemmataceae bacterium]
METTIAAEIQSHAVLDSAVRKANEVLLGAIGRAKHPPRAVWRAVDRQGQSPVIELEMIDELDSVTRRFLPEELLDRFELHFKLTELWGDLIQVAFQGSTSRMLIALRELREEEESREVLLQEV